MGKTINTLGAATLAAMLGMSDARAASVEDTRKAVACVQNVASQVQVVQGTPGSSKQGTLYVANIGIVEVDGEPYTVQYQRPEAGKVESLTVTQTLFREDGTIRGARAVSDIGADGNMDVLMGSAPGRPVDKIAVDEAEPLQRENAQTVYDGVIRTLAGKDCGGLVPMGGEGKTL